MTIAPIPVELSSLSAQTEKNNVTLKWTTASETNNRGFEIEIDNPIYESMADSWIC